MFSPGPALCLWPGGHAVCVPFMSILLTHLHTQASANFPSEPPSGHQLTLSYDSAPSHLGDSTLHWLK